jgi:hypothetical protein
MNRPPPGRGSQPTEDQSIDPSSTCLLGKSRNRWVCCVGLVLRSIDARVLGRWTDWARLPLAHCSLPTTQHHHPHTPGVRQPTQQMQRRSHHSLALLGLALLLAAAHAFFVPPIIVRVCVFLCVFVCVSISNQSIVSQDHAHTHTSKSVSLKRATTTPTSRQSGTSTNSGSNSGSSGSRSCQRQGGATLIRGHGSGGRSVRSLPGATGCSGRGHWRRPSG